MGVTKIFRGEHLFKNFQKNLQNIFKKHLKNYQKIFKKYSKNIQTIPQIFINFVKKISKNALFSHIFSKKWAIHALNFWTFGPKTLFVRDFRENLGKYENVS